MCEMAILNPARQWRCRSLIARGGKTPVEGAVLGSGGDVLSGGGHVSEAMGIRGHVVWWPRRISQGRPVPQTRRSRSQAAP